MPVGNNDDAIIGLGIEFDLASFDAQVETILNKMKVSFSGFTIPTPKFSKPSGENDPVAYGKRTARSLEEITKARIAKEEEAHKLGFRKLEHEYETHSKKVVDLRTKLSEEKDKASRLDLQREIKAAQEETAILRKEYQSRDQVIHGGAGAKNGILGLGRGLLGGIGLGAIGPSLIGAGGAALVGVGMKEAIDLAIKFESAVASFSALTGVRGKDLDMYAEKARSMAKAFGVEAVDSIESFKLIVNALGPQIAKDREALSSMTHDVLLLSKASGSTAAEAAQVLTTTLNQFGGALLSPASQAREMTRIMNTMAAGALQGAAEVPQLSEGMKAVGTVAHQAGVSIEGATAALELLSMNGLIQGSEAGTQYRNVLLRLESGTVKAEKAIKDLGLTFYDVNPEIHGQEEALANLKAGLDKIEDPVRRSRDLVRIFGVENITAANSLLANVKQLHELTIAVTDTNTAQEQANVIMETSAERFKRSKVEAEDLGIALGQKLVPMLNTLGVVANEALNGLRKLFSPDSYQQEKVADLIEKTRGQTKSFAAELVGGKYFNKDIAKKQLVDFAGNALSKGNPLALSMDDAARIVTETNDILDKAIAEKLKTDSNKPKPAFTGGGGGVASGDSRSQLKKHIDELETAMKAEQTIIELDGIKKKHTKEQIEIESLKIEIYYSKLIAEAAKNNAQLKNTYLLTAAKDEARIRDINGEDARKSYDQFTKDEEIHYQFTLSTQSEFDKKRSDLNRKFLKDVENVSGDAEMDLWKMYSKAWEDIGSDELDKKLKSENDLQKKILDAKQKGIELHIKSAKDNISKQLTLEADRYKNELELQNNFYENAIIAAQKDERLLALAKQEHQIAIENITFDHEERIKKIHEDSNKEIVDAFKSTASEGLSTWETQFFGPMNGLAGSLVKNLAKVGEGKLVEGFGKLLGKLFQGPEDAKTTDATQNINHAEITATTVTINTSGTAPAIDTGGTSSDVPAITGINIPKNPGDIFPRREIKPGQNFLQDSLGFPGDTNFRQPNMEGTITSKNAEVFKQKKKADDQAKLNALHLTPNDTGEILQGEKPEHKNIVELGLLAEKIHTVAEIGLETAGHVNLALPLVTSVYETIHNHETYKKDPTAIEESPIEKMLREKKEGTFKGFAVGEDAPNRNTQNSDIAIKSGDVTTGIAGTGVTTDDQKTGEVIATGFTNALSKGTGKNPGADIAKSFLSTGLSLIPGGGLLSMFGGLLGLADGGDYDQNVPTLVGEKNAEIHYKGKIIPVHSPQRQGSNYDLHNSRLAQNYDLHTAARNSSYAGGSSGGNNDALMKEMIASNHAIGEVLDSQRMEVSGGALRRVNNSSYSDTLGKKFGK